MLDSADVIGRLIMRVGRPGQANVNMTLLGYLCLPLYVDAPHGAQNQPLCQVIAYLAPEWPRFRGEAQCLSPAPNADSRARDTAWNQCLKEC